ncbi:uncharacterized protein LOC124412574 isoform X2 [Diprion similis]|uniref:uncharacterized protein LOC124412574 isoform X2 n=1 Tax=Diprion similis TaxID=362088 RepID=UPI001EF8AB05|nr:uncharacterized protein LOC124412574 isoform X2 [Diprion similis]
MVILGLNLLLILRHFPRSTKQAFAFSRIDKLVPDVHSDAATAVGESRSWYAIVSGIYSRTYLRRNYEPTRYTYRYLIIGHTYLGTSRSRVR